MDYRVCVCVLLHIPSYNSIQQKSRSMVHALFLLQSAHLVLVSSYFDFNLSTSFSQFRPNICLPKGTIRLYRKTLSFIWRICSWRTLQSSFQLELSTSDWFPQAFFNADLQPAIMPRISLLSSTHSGAQPFLESIR